MVGSSADIFQSLSSDPLLGPRNNKWKVIVLRWEDSAI